MVAIYQHCSNGIHKRRRFSQDKKNELDTSKQGRLKAMKSTVKNTIVARCSKGAQVVEIEKNWLATGRGKKKSGFRR